MGKAEVSQARGIALAVYPCLKFSTFGDPMTFGHYNVGGEFLFEMVEEDLETHMKDPE